MTELVNSLENQSITKPTRRNTFSKQVAVSSNIIIYPSIHFRVPWIVFPLLITKLNVTLKLLGLLFRPERVN